MLKHLEKIFERVRTYILTKGYKRIEIVRVNPKVTDVSAKFDLEVEDVVINYCKENSLKLRIFTEERGEVNLCKHLDWVLVIDPVDGSTNFKKGIEGSSFNVAVLPASKKISPKDIQYALIGSLISGSYCQAEKGKGTFYQGFFSGFKKKRVFASKNTKLESACIEIDLDFALNEATTKINVEAGRKIERILPLIYPKRQIKHLRRNGSAGMGLMEVATGAVDAYIDLRDISTPENWFPAYLLIKEAGGIFTDWHGKEITEVNDLRQPYSYVASGNEILHQKILESLNKEK